mmetsp:Transcript_10081/g.41813  ORF Transcript_10081/g.41813 Transcript_10081/m.41813 type:complete len:247 (+) Transcript_10081:1464-2204(+)
MPPPRARVGGRQARAQGPSSGCHHGAGGRRLERGFERRSRAHLLGSSGAERLVLLVGLGERRLELGLRERRLLRGLALVRGVRSHVFSGAPRVEAPPVRRLRGRRRGNGRGREQPRSPGESAPLCSDLGRRRQRERRIARDLGPADYARAYVRVGALARRACTRRRVEGRTFGVTRRTLALDFRLCLRPSGSLARQGDLTTHKVDTPHRGGGTLVPARACLNLCESHHASVRVEAVGVVGAGQARA